MKKLKNFKDKEELTEMILALDSAEFGTDIKRGSTKNYEQIGKIYGDLKIWTNRGYSTILDVLMVIMNHSAYKSKDCNEYFIIF